LLSYEQNTINLTEKETLVILYLRNKDDPCSVTELQELVWKQSNDLETHTVETHIYRLRKKIKDAFNDESFILSVKNGYKLN
jgi:DNA-binding response OmpR family regulator